MVSETLEEINARSDASANETNGNNDIKKSKKRKLNLAAPPPAPILNDSTIDSNISKGTLETMKFPYTQPTHTGYLISATLLPLYI